MRMIVYDIEIAKAIPDRKNPPIEGIQYCEGWHDHAGMGIATLCAFDCYEGRYRVFCEDNKEEFRALCETSDIIAGFNSNAFDNKVVEKAWGIQIPPAKSYDLLVEVWKAAGLPPEFNFRTHGGYGLEALAEENLGAKKSGNGALAPIDWQRGRIGSVIDYCLMDVKLTAMLIDLVSLHGYLACPKTGRTLILSVPQ